MKIEITEDKSNKMISIYVLDKCLFEGNYWDFDRSGKGFKKLFESAGIKVEIEEKPYEEWYD